MTDEIQAKLDEIALEQIYGYRGDLIAALRVAMEHLRSQLTLVQIERAEQAIAEKLGVTNVGGVVGDLNSCTSGSMTAPNVYDDLFPLCLHQAKDGKWHLLDRHNDEVATFDAARDTEEINRIAEKLGIKP